MKRLEDTIQLMMSNDYKERLLGEYWQAEIRLNKLIKNLSMEKSAKQELLLRFLPTLTSYRNALVECLKEEGIAIKED